MMMTSPSAHLADPDFWGFRHLILHPGPHSSFFFSLRQGLTLSPRLKCRSMITAHCSFLPLQAPPSSSGFSSMLSVPCPLLHRGPLQSIPNTGTRGLKDRVSFSVAQAGEQWRNRSSLQPRPPGLKPSSHLSLPILGFYHIAQADLELLGSSDLPDSFGLPKCWD
ncbi:UPF0764 protein C16orf89 [Plecturocebus cupreus]